MLYFFSSFFPHHTYTLHTQLQFCIFAFFYLLYLSFKAFKIAQKCFFEIETPSTTKCLLEIYTDCWLLQSFFFCLSLALRQLISQRKLNFHYVHSGFGNVCHIESPVYQFTSLRWICYVFNFLHLPFSPYTSIHPYYTYAQHIRASGTSKCMPTIKAFC